LLTSRLVQRAASGLPSDQLQCDVDSDVADSGAQLHDAAACCSRQSASSSLSSATAGHAAAAAAAAAVQKHCARPRADFRGLLSLRLQQQGDQQQQQQQQQRQAEQLEEEDDSIWIDSTSSSAGSVAGRWMIGFDSEYDDTAAAGAGGMLGAAAINDETDGLADMLQLLGA
jgi:hypothetical protein